MKRLGTWIFRGFGAASLGVTITLGAVSCGSTDETTPGASVPAVFHTTVSTNIAIALDDKTVWVTNPDADSVSVIDASTRAIQAEILLNGAHPSVDGKGNYHPAVTPRALALYDDGKKVYVAGQTSNSLYVIDGASRAVVSTIPLFAEPTSVVVAPDGSAVYVACQMAAKIVKVDPTTDTVLASLDVSEKPFGLALNEDGSKLFASHLLLGPGVSVIDTASFTLTNKVPIADQPVPSPFKKVLPNGPARGLYGVFPRPGTGELWVPHLLLAVDTAQTDPVASPETNLDFESTVFPTISTVNPGGTAEGRRLLFKPLSEVGAQGAFTDVVSGPRAVAFTPDGKLAFLALSASEDVLVFDAETGNKVQLIRPIPSALLEGIVVNHAGTRVYVSGRNTHDITVLQIDETSTFAPVALDGAINTLDADPMPAEIRLGQRLFNTANSAKYPITRNFWVACASCHVEGGSDAVTWLFADGPRDTPTNFGGMTGTGFLLRQARRTLVQQYDETIQVEQGGTYHYDEPSQKADLDALAAYVNHGIPLPQNPYLAADGVLNEAQTRGKALFAQACETCHYGEWLTDSGEGNPTLDLSGPIKLNDIGTCVTKGDHKDKASFDVEGNPRTACDFDTPTLRGIFASAPYFHDGSSETLEDVMDRLPFCSTFSDEEKADLVEYVKTL